MRAWLHPLQHRRSRAVWASARRTIATLESFSHTETDGGRDILAAAEQVRCPKLRAHFERHARDELEHGELFRARAAELRAALPADDPAAHLGPSERIFDLRRQRTELDDHGFFSGDRLEEVGEIGYVAMLHIAERRATAIFRRHRELTRHDPATRAIFERVLKDEAYHVAYTGTFLKRWRREGRTREVKRALAAARGSRMWTAWKQLGARSASRFSHLLFFASYFTLFLPFALIARLGRPASGWQKPLAGGGELPAAKRQY